MYGCEGYMTFSIYRACRYYVIALVYYEADNSEIYRLIILIYKRSRASVCIFQPLFTCKYDIAFSLQAVNKYYICVFCSVRILSAIEEFLKLRHQISRIINRLAYLPDLLYSFKRTVILFADRYLYDRRLGIIGYAIDSSCLLLQIIISDSFGTVLAFTVFQVILIILEVIALEFSSLTLLSHLPAVKLLSAFIIQFEGEAACGIHIRFFIIRKDKLLANLKTGLSFSLIGIDKFGSAIVI